MYKFSELKENHEELYKEALEMSSEVKTKKYYQNVENLVAELIDFSAKTTSLDEYRWLRDATTKWNIIYVSIFNKPKNIELHSPTNSLIPEIPPSNRLLSEEEIEKWIQDTAYYRAFHIDASTDDQGKDDYFHAENMLVSEILDGKFNFALQIPASSYPRLESKWLKDIKLLRAYFFWCERKKGHGHDVNDYTEVCNSLRKMLIDPNLKINPIEFTYVKKYFNQHYFGENDKLKRNEDTGECLDGAHKLVAIKAKRISERQINPDGFKDWLHAETYVEMFYENITSAIIDNDKEKILRVLKAFQYSKKITQKHHVINAFEAIIAISYLNPDKIKELWDESENSKEQLRLANVCLDSFDLEPCEEMSVKVNQDFIAKFNYPNEFKASWQQRLYLDGNCLVFRGVISPDQKLALLNHLESNGIKTEDNEKLIEILYLKTRFIRKDSTL